MSHYARAQSADGGTIAFAAVGLEEALRNLFLCGFAAILLAAGCGLAPLERARLGYQANRDYASLEAIHARLVKGMKRAAVERLLGEPGYSPTEGQFYYLSDRNRDPEGGADAYGRVPLGVVVDYRNVEGAVTDELQTFWMGPIGE